MTVTRLFTGDDGRSHFQEIPDAFEITEISGQSEFENATGVALRCASGDTVSGWINAPRRQHVVILTGEVEIEVTDGSKCRLVPGDILLAEDTTGQGHITRGFGERKTVVISIPG
jgi:quercetin dioxygenase-like cupin family protein